MKWAINDLFQNYARVTRNDHELTLQINKANQENIFKSKQGTTLTLLKQMIND